MAVDVAGCSMWKGAVEVELAGHWRQQGARQTAARKAHPQFPGSFSQRERKPTAHARHMLTKGIRIIMPFKFADCESQHGEAR